VPETGKTSPMTKAKKTTKQAWGLSSSSSVRIVRLAAPRQRPTRCRPWKGPRLGRRAETATVGPRLVAALPATGASSMPVSISDSTTGLLQGRLSFKKEVFLALTRNATVPGFGALGSKRTGPFRRRIGDIQVYKWRFDGSQIGG